MLKLSNNTLGILAVLMATFVWSSSFVALKIALESMEPMSVIFFRMLLASCIFLLFYKKFIYVTITKQDLKYLLLMIFFEPCLYFMFEINALKFTSASQAGVIASTMPLITAILAGIILKEIITKKLILGSIIAIIGAIWLSISANSQAYAPNPMVGNFLEMLAMACGAGYTIVLKHLTKKFSAFFLTAIQAFGGAIFFMPFALYEWSMYGFNISTDGFLAIFYLGAFVTLGGYGLFNYAIALLPASKVSSFINLIPAFTVILGYLILNERLNYMQFLATGIIFLGVFISQNAKIKRFKRRRIKTPLSD